MKLNTSFKAILLACLFIHIVPAHATWWRPSRDTINLTVGFATIGTALIAIGWGLSKLYSACCKIRPTQNPAPQLNQIQMQELIPNKATELRLKQNLMLNLGLNNEEEIEQYYLQSFTFFLQILNNVVDTQKEVPTIDTITANKMLAALHYKFNFHKRGFTKQLTFIIHVITDYLYHHNQLTFNIDTKIKNMKCGGAYSHKLYGERYVIVNVVDFGFLGRFEKVINDTFRGIENCPAMIKDKNLYCLTDSPALDTFITELITRVKNLPDEDVFGENYWNF